MVIGRIVDADTGKAIAGAEVGFRKHEAVSTRTKEDGTFRLASDHEWGPAMVMPIEFTLCGGLLYVAAPGYRTFEKDVGQRVYQAVQLPEIKLKKGNDPAATAAGAGPPPVTDAPPAFLAVAPHPTERFSISILTEEQLGLCSAFRGDKTASRQHDFDVISREGAFPITKYRMQVEDVIALLGSPDAREQKGRKVELRYVLERTQRQAVLTVEFQDGYAIAWSIEATIS